MAQDRLTWRRALPGLIIIGTLLTLITMVFIGARVGSLRGDKYRLYAVSNEARGVLKNTEVWIDGKKAGAVVDIRFRPPTADTSERMVIVMDVLERYRQLVRRDSRVAIRNGGRLISSPVIFITTGTVAAPVLSERDTLHPARQTDMETLTSDFALAAREAAPVFRDLKILAAMLGRSRDRWREVRTDQGEPAIRAVGRGVRGLSRRASSGGTVSALINDDSLLFDRARLAFSRVDSVMLRINRPDGSIGRIAKSDSALTRELSSLRDELSIIRARMQAAEGTLGRWGKDSAITWQMMRREQAMQDLIKDIKKDPARYIAF